MPVNSERTLFTSVRTPSFYRSSYTSKLPKPPFPRIESGPQDGRGSIPVISAALRMARGVEVFLIRTRFFYEQGLDLGSLPSSMFPPGINDPR